MAIDPDLEPILQAIEARLAALEALAQVPVNPHTVIQKYEDDTEIVFKRQ